MKKLLAAQTPNLILLPLFADQMMLVRSVFRSQLRPSVSGGLQSASYYSYSSSSAASAEAEKTIREGPRNDWSRDEIKAVYDSPVLDLLFHGVYLHFSICLTHLIFPLFSVKLQLKSENRFLL